MANASISSLAQIEQQFPTIGRGLRHLQDAVNNLGQQTNAQPIGQTPAPQKPARLIATGGAGIVHMTLSDNSPAFRGNEYHAEIMPHDGNWDTDAHPISLGPSRAFRGAMGSGKYIARACSGYSTSNPSPWVYSDVIDATGDAPPAFHKTTGSGTGGGGYGTQAFNTPLVPKR